MSIDSFVVLVHWTPSVMYTRENVRVSVRFMFFAITSQVQHVL